MSEKVIMTLLSGPALQYIQHLRTQLDANSSYLESHKSEITPMVERYLVKGGIIYDQSIIEREALPLVREAIQQLKAIEKPRRE